MTEKNTRQDELLKYAEKMDIIREMDITKRHFMNENWEPTNHQLSAEEFKRCWICLASAYVKFFYKNILRECSLEDNDDSLFIGWLVFLHNVRKAVVHGQECKCVKQIIDMAGIQRNILINFLDF